MVLKVLKRCKVYFIMCSSIGGQLKLITFFIYAYQISKHTSRPAYTLGGNVNIHVGAGPGRG